MVTRKLANLIHPNPETQNLLSLEIEWLKTKNLRKIHSRERIKEICFEVISAIDILVLVHVDEQEIEKRKIKKERDKPIEYADDVTRWSSWVKIRKDWGSERWLHNPPHGWVYYGQDGSLLWTIYEWKEKWKYEIFMRREVAENPHGATLLIKTMKKKLEQLIPEK